MLPWNSNDKALTKCSSNWFGEFWGFCMRVEIKIGGGRKATRFLKNGDIWLYISLH